MNNNIKRFGLGLLGGMLPLGLFLFFNNPSLEDANIHSSNNNFNTPVHRTRLTNAIPMQGDFVEASENSINSVVHVTTKVVRTQFQRDIFQEFFYGPGAGGKEYKQYGSGSGSGAGHDPSNSQSSGAGAGAGSGPGSGLGGGSKPSTWPVPT